MRSSGVYCAVVVEVDVKGGVCCGRPRWRVVHRPRRKG